MKIKNIELTEKEATALKAFKEGMDCPNEGWLHEIAPFSGKALSGVVSSLTKKGIITTMAEEINQDPSNVCHWVMVTKEFWDEEIVEEKKAEKVIEEKPEDLAILSREEALAMYRCVMLEGVNLRDFLKRLSRAWEVKVDTYYDYIKNQLN